jgi:2-furoyl-CoA dehydrogenase FAD binding subunit
MKPREFDYVRAESVDEATAELAAAGDEARVLAGGLSLVAMLNFRLVETRVLVDISRIEGLSYIRADGDMLEVGAATTQAELMAWDGLGEQAPLLHAAMPNIGHYQTRSRGTVCGSLAHADPSSELPLCLATLGGEVVLRSKRGRRVLKAEEFQEGPLITARAADELIVAARFPLRRNGVGHGFAEVARRHGDFAIVAVAAAVSATGIRVGVGGVADHPAVREWEVLGGDALDDALNHFAWDLGGYDDIHATAKYRRQLVRRLGRRVVEEASACRN